MCSGAAVYMEEKFCPPCHQRGIANKLIVKNSVGPHGVQLIPWCNRCSYTGPSKGPFPHRQQQKQQQQTQQNGKPAERQHRQHHEQSSSKTVCPAGVEAPSLGVSERARSSHGAA